MALVLKRIYEGFVQLEELRDPRTLDDLFILSPLCLVALIAFYVYFFNDLGPRLMENRKPFNVKNAMIIYNTVQIFLNGYVGIIGTKILLNMNSPLCEQVDYSYSPNALLCLHICRMYTYLKLLDIGDTVFFLLRKSYRQITFLHIYHHCGMMGVVWITLRYYAGGSAIWVNTINSYVHCFMFAYYLLTVIDSSWKSNLALKKSLTQIQLVQFTAFVFIYGRITILGTCELIKFLPLVFTIQNFFMMFLFGDFYHKSYIKKTTTV